MFYRPQDGHGLPHNPLNAIVAPRPIGWVSTRGRQGDNLAPYSFFNLTAYVPPQIMFASTGAKADRNGTKDSVSQIAETRVFCVNIADAPMKDQLNASSAALPAGTIFPTEHVRELIEAARAGERLVSRQVFDGSGEDALTLATAVIGSPSGKGKERRWPVSLAYFPLLEETMLPQFEIAFDLAENGVLHDMTLDYGDFTLKADLEKLEPLEQPACR